ncbi:hypothetical protein OU798_16390 [Prolixibacteraceae bacterium Z1-6]|uniref:Carbohydrate-binding family V/XII n=1 Tax=Draconibacterium aestuarii TaxID=2998507 RepID=A0A9X3J5V5_9BACT|nr:hypothetical protein [Prolixibacteraceae bacterium Z1-6]
MRTIIVSLFLMMSTMLFAQETESELSWPREIVENEYTITLYQAQLESMQKNILSGRMALSIKKGDELIFGALWFNARLATDLDERTAVLEAFDIPEIKFPDVDDESKIESLKKIIKADLESIDLEMSLDRILADLEDVQTEQTLSDQLRNEAPEIYYRDNPTVLVIIDGEPILKEVDNTKLESVINTPFLILKKKDAYYIKGGKHWYESKTLVSNNWDVRKRVPNDVLKAAESMLDQTEAESDEVGSDEVPGLIVTTKPSEIILSDGKLEYEPIGETSLLYVKNSENDILLDITSQHHFVLINGRWYSSKTLQDGAWGFVEPEDLPEDFAAIPSEATIASVKVSVPGTEEAREAMYEQQMPQTAVVDRKTATTKVTYDGSPNFEKMEGTSVQYAINTESTVIKIDKTYYCVDDGIWFESSNPDGPWIVSDKRPEEVNEIPPSAPVYNVKYVYIYDSTPEVVYVGYTPGYYHSYMYGGVVVYGTGYYYRPWYGSYYYPRPMTYGFGVHYNPYTGWGFSAGFSYGWFRYSMYSHPGYWGPCGYRHGYRHGYYRGYHRGFHSGYRPGYVRGRYDSRNVYKRRDTGVRSTSRDRVASRPANSRTARPANSRANNVYTDRNGNIYQRDNQGNWNQQNKRPATTRPANSTNRPGQATTRPSTSTRPATSSRPTQTTRPTQSTRPAQSTTRQSQNTRQTQSTQRSGSSTRSSSTNNQLQRDYQNRSRGTQNYQNFQKSKTTTASPQRSTPQRSTSTPQRSSSNGGSRR